MAYYTALVNAWTAGTVPTGYTGTALTGQTTAQKLANLNAWNETGAAPVTFYLTGSQVLNCVKWTEFAALTAQQQSNLLMLCANPGALIGGSAETGQLLAGMFLGYFSPTGPTITALTAMAQGVVTYWWSNNGYSSPIGNPDLVAAGGLT